MKKYAFSTGIFFFMLLAISGCEELGIGNKAELPSDIVGYELVIYNTNVITNPDNLNISSRTVYFFKDKDTILGEGSNNSAPLPTTSYSWISLAPSSGTLLMFYSSGSETYYFDWHEGKRNIEERQTFEYTGKLGNFATVKTEGYYEINER